ncbi:S49 family peptidase [Cocleimonas sp. KMM 6892]|uniref:S49 family peptidase n=1 Tax=unclassified Cocleimonas TaxID=2639732 RepID=UPI002DBB2466|nr:MULTISPECIES: S49 family peptidase [unclassified Cocleimonas]MEB8433847.1 S49 family peptidase [Cocleimonas sp. KMM 6892]MEC4716658.1 S49 family peptidase [Cocleimonas sp. KMM 6895]MEC4746187.1 S49 family peptidase [Cocleimonas sp. KMM 6896]
MLNNENQQAIDALKDVAMAGIKEQRSSRRWSIFFKFATLILLFLLIMAVVGSAMSKSTRMSAAPSYTAVVDVQGVILQGAEASADNIIPALQDAFADKKVKGIILRCNSPGGSPVQSSYVYNEIKRLRGIYKDKKVIAVAADLCASGGYFIISAADEIYANPSSLVGSIGVRMQSFGVVEAMKKIGVENRELTAGENKAILDPFSPRKPEDEAFVKDLLATTHKHFIDAVKAGRGDRLKNDPDIFSGLFWTGEDAKALGLIDDFGSPASVARDVIGAETMVNFSPEKDIFERLSKRIGASVTKLLLESNNSPAPVLYK